jgi:hypothetical protein
VLTPRPGETRQYELAKERTSTSERTLLLVVDGNQACLVFESTADQLTRSVPCRVQALRDAAEGITVHLAGSGGLCSIGTVHGMIRAEFMGAQGQGSAQFLFDPMRLREILAQVQRETA